MEYLVPSGYGEDEFTEKRSRFIGRVWPVETEKEAREKAARMKAEYTDARHNCWCCIIHEGGILRYSDDGEPQGTAGQPMLEVFRRGGIENVCCVVTRYFGGILLGAGGLTRAYAQAAKLSLDAAGISAMRLWKRLVFTCPYSLFERVKLEIEAFGGIMEHAEYGADVTIRALFPETQAAAFDARLVDLTSGTVRAKDAGETYMAAPVEI
jgi:uncharacterized YigZ family protein